ncbi:MAG: hypothetical protein HYY16_13115 [Planctomycetes bacterium]|nr:hypothetical protein [Planctomycetota bacterium]
MLRYLAGAWVILAAEAWAHGQAASALPAQEREEPAPQAPDQVRRKPSRPRFDFRAELAFAYDDNVIKLDRAQEREFLDGTNPEAFRIEAIDDIVGVMKAEGDVKVPLLEASSSTEIGGSAEARAYQTNTILNHEQYELWLAQDLGAEDRIRLEFSLLPELYRRELRDTAVGLFQSAFRRETEWIVDWRHLFGRDLSMKPFVGWREHDYNSLYDFRDRAGPLAGVDVTVQAGRRVELSLEYEFSQLEADAEDFEPDTSYRQHEVEPGVVVKLFSDVRAFASWRVTVREFTTTSDLERVDRTDVKQRLRFGAEARLTDHWRTWAQFDASWLLSDRPNDGATREETEYARRVVLLGVAYTY